MTTAILSALAGEQAGLVEQLEAAECVRHAGRDFWCGELHAQPGGREIPVVVFSASAGAREESEALGAQAYLRKPVDVDTLLATVEKYARP